jgi:hypothetical protein
LVANCKFGVAARVVGATGHYFIVKIDTGYRRFGTLPHVADMFVNGRGLSAQR